MFNKRSKLIIVLLAFVFIFSGIIVFIPRHDLGEVQASTTETEWLESKFGKPKQVTISGTGETQSAYLVTQDNCEYLFDADYEEYFVTTNKFFRITCHLNFLTAGIDEVRTTNWDVIDFNFWSVFTNVGLFKINQGEIYNILLGENGSGIDSPGGVTTIETVNNYTYQLTGGLVAINGDSGIISGCGIKGDTGISNPAYSIAGGGFYGIGVGGIAGLNRGIISNCYAINCNIKAKYASSGYSLNNTRIAAAGGIVGINTNNSEENAEISVCISSGNTIWADKLEISDLIRSKKVNSITYQINDYDGTLVGGIFGLSVRKDIFDSTSENVFYDLENFNNAINKWYPYKDGIVPTYCYADNTLKGYSGGTELDWYYNYIGNHRQSEAGSWIIGMAVQDSVIGSVLSLPYSISLTGGDPLILVHYDYSKFVNNCYIKNNTSLEDDYVSNVVRGITRWNLILNSGDSNWSYSDYNFSNLPTRQWKSPTAEPEVPPAPGRENYNSDTYINYRYYSKGSSGDYVTTTTGNLGYEYDNIISNLQDDFAASDGYLTNILTYHKVLYDNNRNSASVSNGTICGTITEHEKYSETGSTNIEKYELAGFVATSWVDAYPSNINTSKFYVTADGCTAIFLDYCGPEGKDGQTIESVGFPILAKYNSNYERLVAYEGSGKDANELTKGNTYYAVPVYKKAELRIIVDYKTTQYYNPLKLELTYDHDDLNSVVGENLYHTINNYGEAKYDKNTPYLPLYESKTNIFLYDNDNLIMEADFDNYIIIWRLFLLGSTKDTLIASSITDDNGKENLSLDREIIKNTYKDYWDNSIDNINWEPTLTTDNAYILHLYIFPKVEINLDPNPQNNDTIEVKGDPVTSSKPQKIYTLTGTNIIYMNEYEDPEDYPMESIKNRYTLMGFFDGTSTEAKEVLNASYGIVGDGSCFDSDKLCILNMKSEPFTLYAKWESKDICTITVKYQGPSISNEVYYFYYKVGMNDSLPDNAPSNALKQYDRVSNIKTSAEGYTYKDTVYSDNASTFLSVMGKDNFRTTTTTPYSISGPQTVTIIIEFEIKQTEEPDSEYDSLTFKIYYVVGGSEILYKTLVFNYMSGEGGSIGFKETYKFTQETYNEYVYSGVGYAWKYDTEEYGNVEYTRFFSFKNNGESILTISSAPSDTAGPYEVELYVYFEEEKTEITIQLNFTYDYYYYYNGVKKSLDVDSDSETWIVKENGRLYEYIEDYRYDFISLTADITSKSSRLNDIVTIDNNYPSYITVDVTRDVFDLSESTTYYVNIKLKGELEVGESERTTQSVSVRFTGVYYKEFTKESNYNLADLNYSTSGRYDNSQGLYEYTFTTNVTIIGECAYAGGKIAISSSFKITGYIIPTSVGTTIAGKYNTDVQTATKPNGYVYNANSWVDGTTAGTKGTGITFGSEVSDVDIAELMYDEGIMHIYQDWQYGSYTITMNKNKYSSLGKQNYTAGENVALPTEITINGSNYEVSDWKIISAETANNDTEYNISTTAGFRNSIKESNGYKFKDYSYSKSNLMYGNFTVEPIFDENLFKDQKLVFDFGITGEKYISGYSNAQVYGKNKSFDTVKNGTETVTFEVVLENLNSEVDLSEILNDIYKTIPKFYQEGNVKYYLVGWTGTSYKGTYKEENREKIYLFDRDTIPGNVVTDSPLADGTGGTIYAVWATLYEIRIALNEDSSIDKEVSLYNGSTLIQRGDDLKAEEIWQDSYDTTGVNYYTFYYGETLENKDITLYFDPTTAIGSNPTTAGYSLSYKHYDTISSLSDLSLKSISGYQIFANKGASVYYIKLNNDGSITTSTSQTVYKSFEENYSVQFNSFVELLISKGINSVINIMPLWEETNFDVIVNGDSSIDLDAIKNYQHTFTVKATGGFNFWPEDANDDIVKYDGWYLDTLTDTNNNKLWEQTIDGTKTALPMGINFYDKILKVENNKVTEIYSIKTVQNKDNHKLILTLEFDASYIGAIYALEIQHFNSSGKELTSTDNFEITTTPDGLIEWINAGQYLPNSFVASTEEVNNGSTNTNYFNTAVVRLLPKYSYSETKGFDNSLAFENYKNKLFLFNGTYYLTLEDKAEFEESELKELAMFKSAMYSLDFYDYSKNTSITSSHECYDMNGLSIELSKDGKTKVFKPDTYGSTFEVNYDNGKCNWIYNSTGLSYNSNQKVIYARWMQKIYDLNLAVNFNSHDSNSGYLVAEIKNGNVSTYYAYVYLNDGSGSGNYKLYKLTSLSGSFYAEDGWKNKITDEDSIKETTILEVPAGSTVTITAYGQDKDINLDDMIGYRFKNVDITNPYSSEIFTCDVGENTYINYIGVISDDPKECDYDYSTTTSYNYIYSTGTVTKFDFTNTAMNEAFELHEKIYLVAHLEKIVYSLIGTMEDRSAGTLSYSYKESKSGLKSFTLNDITVGDNLKVSYSSSLGYQIDGWNFTNNKNKTSSYETNSLIWTDGQDYTKQPINAKFLREYVYKGETSYPTNIEQTLGTVSPITSKIEFTINVSIYNNLTFEVLENYTIENSNNLVKLNDGTKLVINGNYELILNLNQEKSAYDYYLNSGVEYAVLKMYLADKYSKEYKTEEYDFPIKNLASLDFELTQDVLGNLIYFTAGTPVSYFNREIKVVVFVAPIVTINSVTNEELQSNTDPYDIKFGERQVKAGDIVLASALDREDLTKKDTQYAYIGQKVKFSINSLNSTFYSGALVYVNQNGLKQDEFNLSSAGSKEISILDSCEVNVKFIPATFDLSVKFFYKGKYYENDAFNQILNLADVQILEDKAEFNITDTEGNVRTTKFFFGDTLTLNFGVLNFNELFRPNDELTEYNYRVKINGETANARSNNYSVNLTGTTDVVIEIIDLTTNTVYVQTNLENCGSIYGVTKSETTNQIDNSAVEFVLLSGDELKIYIKESTGYRFMNYEYNQIESTVTPILVMDGVYQGYYEFILIDNYNSSLKGLYTLNFELINYDVELVYVADGEEDSNAGSNYYVDKSNANINDELTISNRSNTLQNEGYRFIGYTVGTTYFDGQEVIDNGSYQVTLKLADYSEYINQTDEKVIIYINFIHQYKINIANKGNDFGQTKVSLYEDNNIIFKDYSSVKLPYNSEYKDSSNYTDLEYKLVVEVKSGLDLYYINLYCNNTLIEDVVITKNSVNGNASSLEYIFRLESKDFNVYNLSIEYMPEKLETTIKEYYIDEISQVEDYINNGNLTSNYEHILSDEEIGVNIANKSNMNISFTTLENSLFNRYNVLHNFNISVDNSNVGVDDNVYSIYQVWINEELVFNANSKTNSYQGSWTITENTEIKVIYKALYTVSE